MANNTMGNMSSDVKPLKSYKTGTYFYPKSVLRAIMMSDSDTTTLDENIYKKVQVSTMTNYNYTSTDVYIPLFTGSGTNNKNLFYLDGFRLLATSSMVHFYIGCGNADSNNQGGCLYLKNTNSGYSKILPSSTLSNTIYIQLPSKSGTLALNDDLNSVSNRLDSATNDLQNNYLPRDGSKTMLGAIKYDITNCGKGIDITQIISGAGNSGYNVNYTGYGYTVLSSGHASYFENSETDTDDTLYLMSDYNIYFFTNLKSLEDNDARYAILDNSLNFYPYIDQAGSLGTSSKRWANVNAVTFHGELDGNAATTSKLKTAVKLTVGNKANTFNGTTDLSWTLAEIGASSSDHTHSTLTIQGAGTTLKTYNGSSAVTVNLTANNILAVPVSEFDTYSRPVLKTTLVVPAGKFLKIDRADGTNALEDSTWNTFHTDSDGNSLAYSDGKAHTSNIWVPYNAGIRQHESAEENGSDGTWIIRPFVYVLAKDSEGNTYTEKDPWWDWSVGIGNSKEADARLYSASGYTWTGGSTVNYYLTTSNFKTWFTNTKLYEDMTKSDKRLKDEILPNLTIFENLYMDIKPIVFKFHDNLDRDINNNFIKQGVQFGVYAQDIIDSSKKEGLDCFYYNLVDIAPEDELSVDILRYIEDGKMYKFNYDSLNVLNTHMTQKALREIEKCNEVIDNQNKEIESLKNELSSIKEQLSSLIKSLSL